MKKAVQFVLIGMVLVLANCSTDAVICVKEVAAPVLDAVPKAQLATDIGRISAYLSANSIVAVEDPSGLRYVVTSLGTGETPCLSSTVSATYTGRILLQNNTLGSPFDSSATPVSFKLSNLILGWQVAFPKLPVGTSAILYIPSGLAYKTAVNGSIPANSVLVFNVTITSFQ